MLMIVVSQYPTKLRKPDSTLRTDFFRYDIYSNSTHHIILKPGAMQIAIQSRMASNHVGVLLNLPHAYRIDDESKKSLSNTPAWCRTTPSLSVSQR